MSPTIPKMIAIGFGICVLFLVGTILFLAYKIVGNNNFQQKFKEIGGV